MRSSNKTAHSADRRLAVFWLCFGAVVTLFAIITLRWTLIASDACMLAFWWRAVHSPPGYRDLRGFLILWPPAMVLLIVGVLT